MDRQTLEYHPLIGYKFIPNLQTRIKHESGGYLIKTNNFGFRSEIEFTQLKIPNSKRILLFGDSFTAGDGVSNKKRYSDLLMQMLPSTEIYNFGMPGTGTDQQYLIYREYAENIEHDLIILAVLVENIRRVNAKYWFYYNDKNEKIVYQKPYFELKDNQLLLRNVPVNPVETKFDELPASEKETLRHPALRFIIKRLKLSELKSKVTKHQPLPQYNSTKTKEWNLLKSILVKWISEINKPILLIPLPLYDYIEDKSDYRNVEKRFEELNGLKNLTIYNPINELKQYSLEERRMFRFDKDIHPTPLLHKAFATAFKIPIESLLNQTT